MGVGSRFATNLKALCRKHHLAKTFIGWHDEQLPDGTVIWRAPTGHPYITAPGSAWLFPQLAAPTVDPADALIAGHRRPRTNADPGRTLMMPCRTRTRAQDRARYLAAERARNHEHRHSRKPARPSSLDAWTQALNTPADPDADPPPF